MMLILECDNISEKKKKNQFGSEWEKVQFGVDVVF